MIYTEEEFTFYGLGKQDLAEKYADLVAQKRAYTGGDPKTGFFGIGNAALPAEDLLKIIDEIKNIFAIL